MATNVFYFERNAAAQKVLRELYGAKANIQPAQIRLEEVLADNTASVTKYLGLGNNSGNQRPTESTLSQNDSFVATFVSLGIAKVPNAVTANSNAGNVPIYYYPDQNVFNQAADGADPAEWAALESVYNGFMGIKSDTDEIIYSQDLQRYRVVPRTQYAAGPPVTLPSYEGRERVAFDSPVIFEGNKSNEINLNFASQASRATLGGDPAVGYNLLVLMLYGFRIRNASEALTLYEGNLVKQGKLMLG